VLESDDTGPPPSKSVEEESSFCVDVRRDVLGGARVVVYGDVGGVYIPFVVGNATPMILRLFSLELVKEGEERTLYAMYRHMLFGMLLATSRIWLIRIIQ
jgi:hypothetical protein